MTIRGLLIVALLSSSSLTFAAQAPPQAAVPPPPPPVDRVDVDRLPLDLQRLERQLRASGERENWDGFRLRYSVEVFGKAPTLQFFDPKDVASSGPIPYGAPTHKEMIEVMTPKEYRAPVMDFAAVMRWLEGKLK